MSNNNKGSGGQPIEDRGPVNNTNNTISNIKNNNNVKDLNNNENAVNSVDNSNVSSSVGHKTGTDEGSSTSSKPTKDKHSGKRFKLPFFNKKSSKPGKPTDEPINEEGVVSGRRRTSSVGEKDMETVRKNSKALAIRRYGPHGIEPETQSAPVN